MVTTIQLNESVRDSLNRFKQEKKQTYEDTIINLLKIAEHYKRNQEQLLIQGCKEMAEENLKIAKEGECALMDGLDRNEKW